MVPERAPAQCDSVGFDHISECHDTRSLDWRRDLCHIERPSRPFTQLRCAFGCRDVFDAGRESGIEASSPRAGQHENRSCWTALHLAQENNSRLYLARFICSSPWRCCRFASGLCATKSCRPDLGGSGYCAVLRESAPARWQSFSPTVRSERKLG